MKRTNKLHEAMAIVRSAQNQIERGLNGLRFGKDIRDQLKIQGTKASEELSSLHDMIESILEAETGLTEKQKWVNAERNLRGVK